MMAFAAPGMDYSGSDYEDDAASTSASTGTTIMATPRKAAAAKALATPPRGQELAARAVDFSSKKRHLVGQVGPKAADGPVATCHICLSTSQAVPPALQHNRQLLTSGVRNTTYTLTSLEAGPMSASRTERLLSSTASTSLHTAGQGVGQLWRQEEGGEGDPPVSLA